MKKSQNVTFDLLKTFAIIAIVLWHFEMIPTWVFTFSIPLFVFITASLYQGRSTKMTFSKNGEKVLRILFMIAVTTFFCFFFNLPKFYLFESFPLELSINGIFYQNPWLGSLWYFLLYFQIIFAIYIVSFFERKNIFHFAKYGWGVASFLISQIFCYVLIYASDHGRGATGAVFAWTLFVWAGLYHFDEINSFFQKRKTLILFFISFLSILFLFLALFLLGSKNSFFDEFPIHPIFPVLFFQITQFILLFSLTEMIIRFPMSPKVLSVISAPGKYSWAIYMFHNIIYYNIPFFHTNALLAFFLVLVFSTLSGIFLNFLYEKMSRMPFSIFHYFQK